jgi:trimethylamine--corrinoid protein Co-methyltransferase
LDTKQTLRRFRDFWYPGLLDRRRWEQWVAEGATTLGQRLSARVKEILKEHRPKPLAQAKRQKIQEILAQAAK